MPIDDAGIPFNPKTLKSTTEKRGVENLFKKKADDVPWKETTAPFNPKAAQFYDEIVEESTALAKRTGKDVRSLIEERIGYKFTGNESMKEIIDIVEAKFFKADGGRIGFNQGGWSPGAGRDDRGYKSDHPSHGGGDGGYDYSSVTVPLKTAAKNIAMNKIGEKTGVASVLGKFINPLTKAMVIKGIYDKFKNPNIEDEDIILSEKKDGGRIGYDVGGLTGQAKDIYDSWISAGHSSQDALDYLSSRGMYDAGGGGGLESIINTQQSIIPGAGGSGGMGIQTPIGQNISNFQNAINTRQNRLNDPNKIAEFAYSMGMPKQASVNELLARGMRGPRDTTLMSNIPFGISGLISKALPDMYGDMTLADQITTQAYMGYTDPNTYTGNKDPFGYLC
jgi:hypothetical protein